VDQLRARAAGRRLRTLVVAGPQAPADHLAALQMRASRHDALVVQEFSDDMSGLLAAADLVVAMGGYNTVCDILTFARRAVVVPRIRPVREQSIRAARMSERGYFSTVPAEQLSVELLATAMRRELERPGRTTPAGIDLDGLPTLAAHLDALFAEAPTAGVDRRLVPAVFRVREAS
jgi:predicted glycosyltransferase